MSSSILRALSVVADRLSPEAAETALLENGGKHVHEVAAIQAAGSDVVDLGGGVGVNLLVLRELGHQGRLALVDRFSEYDEDNRMGSRDRALPLLRAAGVEVIEADFWPGIRLPVDDAAFDVACCFDVVEHLPGHPLRQLRELRRVLRVGGRCLLSGPNAASLMKRLKLLAGRHPYSAFEEWTGEHYYEHFREYLPHEYGDLLRSAGFGDVVVEPSAVVTVSRARNRYFRGRRRLLSPTSLALLGLAAVESAVPSLRHSVYATGTKPRPGEPEAADA